MLGSTRVNAAGDQGRRDRRQRSDDCRCPVGLQIESKMSASWKNANKPRERFTSSSVSKAGYALSKIEGKMSSGSRKPIVLRAAWELAIVRGSRENIDKRATVRIVRTNSRRISGVRRHSTGVLQSARASS